MLRRLSPKSQKIIQQAQDIARRYEQNYVDTEHVLLAIAETGDSPATEALQQSGATTEKLRRDVERFIKEAPQQDFVVGRLPGTLHFRNVVARAIEIAETSRAAAVEPEHLLISLSREEGSLASQALSDMGLDAARLDALLTTDRKTG